MTSQTQSIDIVKFNTSEMESSTEALACNGLRNFEYNQNLEFSGSYSLGHPGTVTDINSHLRRFEVIGDYRIIEFVTFFFRGLAEVEMRIYSIDSSDPLDYNNMTLHESTNYIPEGFAYGLKSIPVSTVIPVGKDIVLELSVCAGRFPSCSRIGYNSYLFGSMTNPNQTAPSYLSFNRGPIRDVASFSTNSAALASVMFICASDGIVPTLTQWTTVVLALCLLIFALLSIRQQTEVTAHSTDSV